jgi:hypothetical protein
MFPAHCKAPIVLKPGEQPFNFPATAVAAESTPILRAVLPIATMWSDHLDTVLSQVFVKAVRIIGVIAD